MNYTTAYDEFIQMLNSPEGQNLEFKQETYKDEIALYSAAFHNAAAGISKFIIGATDKMPREITGVSGLSTPGDIVQQVYDKVSVHVFIEAFPFENEILWIIHIPESRGSLASYNNSYPIRRGSSISYMTAEEIYQFQAPSSHQDFSATITDATIAELDPDMLMSYVADCEINLQHKNLDPETLLHNLLLFIDGYATAAAVILFGTPATVRREVPTSQISYIYSSDKSMQTSSNHREDFQIGVWGTIEQLWSEINSRNQDQIYQHKFSEFRIPSFNEASIREAIANAICHRDYNMPGAVFVTQYSSSIEISSPGGFIEGVTVPNFMRDSKPRNDLLAQAFQHAGKVDRAGYGIVKMFERAMQEIKPLPDYSNSDAGRVRLELYGELVHTKLAEHIRHSANMAGYELSLEQYQALCYIAFGERIADQSIKKARKKLLKDGIIKSSGTGMSTSYSLAVESYRPPELFNGEKASVLLLLQILNEAAANGLAMSQIVISVPDKSEKQVRRILNSMKRDGMVRIKGMGRSSIWVITDKGRNFYNVSDAL